MPKRKRPNFKFEDTKHMTEETIRNKFLGLLNGDYKLTESQAAMLEDFRSRPVDDQVDLRDLLVSEIFSGPLPRLQAPPEPPPPPIPEPTLAEVQIDQAPEPHVFDPLEK